MTVIHGDSLHILPTLNADSVDAIVCDPPYGLSFMGKEWDHGVPGEAFWREALRVAKPGAHLVAFGGTRTYHRLACAIEDAGWEVRDCLSYLYGSGFPKSLAVDKAIDKMDAAEEQMARRYRFTQWVVSTGLTAKTINQCLTATDMGRHYTDVPPDGKQPAIMTLKHLDAVRHLINEVPEWVERECAIRSVESKNFAEREVVGKHRRLPGDPSVPIAGCVGNKNDGWFDITAPATDAAKRWHGWGTALKPAWEPIILARKPLTGTVAANVTRYGTGGINVDGCRIGTESRPVMIRTETVVAPTAMSGASTGATSSGEMTTQGRWPANVLLDEAVAEQMGDVARYFYTAKAPAKERWGILTCECKAVSVPVWENADQNHDALTDATSLQKDISEANSVGDFGCNTPLSGNKHTDQSLTDGISITSAETSKTTDSKTCGLSAQPNTSASTAGASCVMGFGGNRASDAESASQSRPTVGISAAKAGPSTGDVGPVTSLRSYTTSACEKCGANFKVESHATVKPIALMRWLCRLVTPKGGLILDPFTGSGSTGCAAVLEGFRFVGIEREPEYVAIAEKRIAHWAGQVKDVAPDLFSA